jgi:hypothetical protein
VNKEGASGNPLDSSLPFRHPDAKFLRVQVCPSCRFEANYSSFVPFLEKHGTCPMCDQEIVRTPHETKLAALEILWQLVRFFGGSCFFFLEMVRARMTAAFWKTVEPHAEHFGIWLSAYDSGAFFSRLLRFSCKSSVEKSLEASCFFFGNGAGAYDGSAFLSGVFEQRRF